MGGAIGIFIIIAGVAYYFYPDAIKNIFGIGIAADNVAEIDPGGLALSSDTDEMPSNNDVEMQSAASNRDNGSSNVSGVATIEVQAPSSDVASDDGDIISDEAPTPIAENNPASATASLPSLPSPSPCSFPGDAPSTTREIIFNEIAWMGSASSSNAEWMEIKNITTAPIDLSGWELFNTSEKIKIMFSSDDAIPAGGLLLLMRASASSASGTAPAANEKIYSGDLVNGGDILALMDPQCNASDYLDAFNGWPGGNNTTKQTLERDADGVGWHTSTLPGGTPGAENSAGPPPAEYTLTIAFEGDAPGLITSDPATLACAVSCKGSYASGTQIMLTPIPGNNSVFDGWSGLCYGEMTCSFAIGENISIMADFQSAFPPPAATTPTVTSTATTTDLSAEDPPRSTLETSSTPPSAPDHVLISAVQIAGASSSNDFAKLYNPTGVAVDMSGWKLHKKSATGTDYSLKEFPTGSVISRWPVLRLG